MPKEINFIDQEPRYIFERDCLAFTAIVEDNPVECFVTFELLWEQFGAREWNKETMLEAYEEHKSELQLIAKAHIENNWIDEDNRVFLTTRHTRLTVDYGHGLHDWPDGREIAMCAHRVLTEIIGPRAKTVNVKWDATAGVSGRHNINLQITDPQAKFLDSDPPYSLTGSISKEQWEDPSSLRLVLLEIWGSVLRARSRKLAIEA